MQDNEGKEKKGKHILRKELLERILERNNALLILSIE
jgi:hypothetical protein